MRSLLFVATDLLATPYDSGHDNVDEGTSGYDSRGIHLMGHRLTDIDHAVSVNVPQGLRLITDGPFVETKEWIAGFDPIEGRGGWPSRSGRGVPRPDSARSKSRPPGRGTQSRARNQAPSARFWQSRRL